MFANRYAVPELERLAREGRVVAFDAETTGLTPRDEICQLAAVEYVAGKEARTFMRHLRVDRPMSDAAFRTHGISPEFLAAHGVAPAEALREFLAFLGEGALLVAHNLPFDMGMLRNACSRAGVPFDPWAVETCDTLALARRLLPGRKSYALGDLLADLGAEGVNSHDALDDSRACGNVLLGMVGLNQRPAPGDWISSSAAEGGRRGRRR